MNWRLRLRKRGIASKHVFQVFGKAEPFRTSGGKAALSVHSQKKPVLRPFQKPGQSRPARRRPPDRLYNICLAPSLWSIFSATRAVLTLPIFMQYARRRRVLNGTSSSTPETCEPLSPTCPTNEERIAPRRPAVFSGTRHYPARPLPHRKTAWQWRNGRGL